MSLETFSESACSRNRQEIRKLGQSILDEEHILPEDTEDDWSQQVEALDGITRNIKLAFMARPEGCVMQELSEGELYVCRKCDFSVDVS